MGIVEMSWQQQIRYRLLQSQQGENIINTFAVACHMLMTPQHTRQQHVTSSACSVWMQLPRTGRHRPVSMPRSNRYLHDASFLRCDTFVLITLAYQHWRWKAAGQWSQHSKSPPSLQLSQVSWLVALPLLRTSLTNFRLLFSTSSDFGGANSVWICCKSCSNL